jgi:hypothetical protein
LSRRPNDPQRLLIMQLVPAAAADSWRDNILDAIKDARQ